MALLQCLVMGVEVKVFVWVFVNFWAFLLSILYSLCTVEKLSVVSYEGENDIVDSADNDEINNNLTE